jgi:2-deoxy-D-gluconate 3-dehydrogenase
MIPESLAKVKLGMQLFNLQQKVAMVTGASGGIGRAIAIGLAKAGADVAVLGCSHSPLELTQHIEALGRRSVALQGDISDRAFINEAVSTVTNTLGRIEILVNCAGINIRGSSIDFTEEDWLKVLDVNLNSVFVLCQRVGREMVSQRAGKIINIASVVSFSGGINVVAYAASKGGVAQLTKALANEWAAFNVNVNAIAPGYIFTEMTRPLKDNASRCRQILERVPAQRWGNPEDLVGATVFLASPASDYVHGHILVVDGGWMSR